MPLTVQFLEEIHRTAKTDWPAIVKKYGLTPAEIEKAAEILRKEKESRDSWAESACKKHYYKQYA